MVRLQTLLFWVSNSILCGPDYAYKIILRVAFVILYAHKIICRSVFNDLYIIPDGQMDRWFHGTKCL